MAALKALARHEGIALREPHCWVAVWKVGRHWHSKRIWSETDINTINPETIKPEAMVEVAKILGTDPRAVILNGYYCGRLYEDTTDDDIARWIRVHYDSGKNLLKDNFATLPPDGMTVEQNVPETHADEYQPATFDPELAAAVTEVVRWWTLFKEADSEDTRKARQDNLVIFLDTLAATVAISEVET